MIKHQEQRKTELLKNESTMQLARVIGHTTATIKHDSLNGWRLNVVQILDAEGEGEGDPFIALDSLGSRTGDTVMLTSDSKLIGKMTDSKNTPARFAILGLPDEKP